MTISDCIALFSLCVAIFAAIYTLLSNTKKFELTYLHYKEISTWHAQVVETLIALKLLPESNKENKTQLLVKLSALIESGRLYFPNILKHDDFGMEKPLAYQGYRNIVLDFLVYSYQLFEKDNYTRYTQHAEILQRLFTSHIYEFLKPSYFNKKINKNTNIKKGIELTIEDFLAKTPEAINILYAINEDKKSMV